MTNAIDSQGNTVAVTSNITNEDMRSTSRDATAEKVAKGHLTKHSNWISDEDMSADLDIVQRNGSRQYANGDYQSGDIIMINGMEVEYETAVSLGMVTSQDGQGVSPQEAFGMNAENANHEPEANHFEGAELLSAQIDMATGGKSETVLSTFANDIVENGSISEAGLAYAASELGMSEQVVAEQFTVMQELGGDNLVAALEVGDGMGEDRVEFLVDRFEHGSPHEQRMVRQMWTAAALGKMTPREMQDQFDRLYAPYS